MNRYIHGYYTVKDKIFNTKIQALIYATQIVRTNKVLEYCTQYRKHDSLVNWHFNDEVFSQYNWTIEPENSLEYLYYERAKNVFGIDCLQRDFGR